MEHTRLFLNQSKRFLSVCFPGLKNLDRIDVTWVLNIKVKYGTVGARIINTLKLLFVVICLLQ